MLPLQKSLPPGGKVPPKGADEGAGFVTISCYAGRISPPAGGEFLCPWRQRNQNATGDGSDEHSVLIVAYPTPSGPSGHLPLTGGVGPGPHYGGSPLGQTENFRRAKMEWLSAIPPGPLGPGFAKIAAAAVPQQCLALPNQCSRFISAVGAAHWAAHQAFPLPGGRWHGEAVTDEGDRQILISLPPFQGEGAGLGPDE